MELDDEIQEIKKEIIESRGLVIKTNNLANSLGADIKSIAKRQGSYERRFTWTSATAYTLFALLSFTGLKLASDARIREIDVEKEQLRSRVSTLEQQLSQEQKRAEQRQRAETRAAKFYDLVKLQKRSEALQVYNTLRGEELSDVEANMFRDIVERFRLELSVSRYQNGLELLRTGRYNEAADTLQEALKLREDGTHAVAARYHLAIAQHKLGKHAEAIVLAKSVVDQNLDRELQDDAMALVAQCAEDIGSLDEAKNAWRALQKRWPRSTLATTARSKLAELSKKSNPSSQSK
jgi:TolA-binding protein